MDGLMLTKHELDNLSKEEIIEKFLELQKLHCQLKTSQKALSKTDLMINKFQPRKLRKKKQKLKKIDFLQCNYRYVALKVSYLGWDYNGLQENGDLPDTIEGVLKEALRQVKLVGRDLPVRFTKCGRTDKGVSAFAQVMSVMVRTQLTKGPHVTKWKDCMDDNDDVIKPVDHRDNLGEDDHNAMLIDDGDIGTDKQKEFDYVLMLNQVLPPEVRILGWTPVDETFSARWRCTQRGYRYYFIRGKLNVDKMNAAAKLLCGTHDYRNFCKLNVANCRVFVRRIDNFTIQSTSEPSAVNYYSVCCAIISASGFLYHQVRQMMTVLFLIGMGREEPSLISNLLDVENCTSRPAYDLAPAFPLVLFDSLYDDMTWNLDRCTAVRLLMHFQQYWSELTLKAHMVKELITLLENDTTTQMSGSVDGLMGVVDSESLTVRELNNEIVLQSVAHGANYQFLKQPCSLQLKAYRKVLDRQKCKSFEEQLAAFERKRQLSLESSSGESKKTCV